MIMDLGHTAFGVYDMERALTFHKQVDIEESFRLHRDDRSLMLVYLHIAGDRFIELFPNGPEPDPDRVQSFRHICLAVDDLEQMVAEPRDKGIEIERELKRGLDQNLQAWIHDPDGNLIELMQLVENSPQRRTARGEPTE